ncbi:MAG: hypothetical protein H0W08_27560 [Acidobacteria bacterium]|nr:hypothetical protein [Acidobacteriota bacterium]
MIISAGTRLGTYEILGKLGAGGPPPFALMVGTVGGAVDVLARRSHDRRVRWCGRCPNRLATAASDSC